MTTTFKCVLDTSVCIKYFIADSLTPKVIELFAHFAYPQAEVFVPDLFYIECTNVFLKYVRANMYTSTKLIGAKLTEAKLNEATLYEAYLTGARLKKANLSRANLTGANLTGANCLNQDLQDLRMYRIKFLVKT